MKKISFLLYLFLFVGTTSFSQIKQGSVFLGGDIGVSSQTTTTSTNINSDQKGFGISPVFGKAVKKNLVVGFETKFYFSNGDFIGDDNDRKERTYGFGVFLRKYKQLSSGDFSIFLQARAGGEYYKRDQGYNSPTRDELKQFAISINGYPGVSYAVSKKLQIETGFKNLISIYYTSGKGNITGITPVTYKTRTFNVYSSLENLSYLYIGFRWLINKES